MAPTENTSREISIHAVMRIQQQVLRFGSHEAAQDPSIRRYNQQSFDDSPAKKLRKEQAREDKRAMKAEFDQQVTRAVMEPLKYTPPTATNSLLVRYALHNWYMFYEPDGKRRDSSPSAAVSLVHGEAASPFDRKRYVGPLAFRLE